MTKQQKLTKLIEIAVENGWEIPKGWNSLVGIAMNYEEEPHILFSHSFSKAIWGEVLGVIQVCYKSNKVVPEPIRDERTDLINVWQYHLQAAVISPDPLQYYIENCGVEL